MVCWDTDRIGQYNAGREGDIQAIIVPVTFVIGELIFQLSVCWWRSIDAINVKKHESLS